jgi:hypothetical protein
MSKENIVRDDLTREIVADATEQKITWQGKSYTLDLSAASVGALTEFVTGQGTDALARLLGKPEPAKPASPARARKSTGEITDATKARAWRDNSPAGQTWAAENPNVKDGPGYDSGRGRLPGALRKAWAAAGSPFEPAWVGESEPASEPPAASTSSEAA